MEDAVGSSLLHFLVGEVARVTLRGLRIARGPLRRIKSFRERIAFLPQQKGINIA